MGSCINLAGGNTLFVRDWGAGPPVLFLAGWAMHSRIWNEAMIRLAGKGLRTIAYDRRGHGRSSEWGNYDYDTLAGDLAAVIEALDLEDMTLVSHSGAAGELLRYCSVRDARRVRQLIMIGATGPAMMASPGRPGISAGELDMLISQLATDLDSQIDGNIDAFAPGLSHRMREWLTGMVLDCSRRAIVAFQETIARADLTADARMLRVPLRLIHGERDVSTPLDATARRYLELVPSSDLIVYPGAAHGLMLTYGDRLAADIARLVAA